MLTSHIENHGLGMHIRESNFCGRQQRVGSRDAVVPVLGRFCVYVYVRVTLRINFAGVKRFKVPPPQN